MTYIEIAILILIWILARITLRGLFDRNWKEKAQTIIDGRRNEKNFWYLMSQDINAEKIFQAYIRTMNQNDYIRVGDCVMDSGYSEYKPNPNDLDKKIIPNEDGLKLVNSLQRLVEKREAIITDYLKKNSIQFSEVEIRKCFEEFEERNYVDSLSSISKKYERFVQVHLDSILKGEKNGLSIWNTLKEFEDKANDFEWDSTGNKRVKFLMDLKMDESEINTSIINMISKLIKDESAQARVFKKALVEWQQLHMLRWCVIDIFTSFYPIGSTGLSRLGWRILGYISE